MGKKKNRKDKSPEYCPGYVDANGIWNNGFPCPRWGELERSYCCGYDQDRFCCPPPEDAPKHETPPDNFSKNIPVIVGVCLGVGMVLIIILLCAFCPMCPLSKRRRRRRNRPANPGCPGCRHQGHMAVVITNENSRTYPVRDSSPGPFGDQSDRPPSYCHMCRANGLRWQHGMSDVEIMFPLEDPPPYSDEDENEEDSKEESDNDRIDTSPTRFTSFMGSSENVHTTRIPNRPNSMITRFSLHNNLDDTATTVRNTNNANLANSNLPRREATPTRIISTNQDSTPRFHLIDPRTHLAFPETFTNLDLENTAALTRSLTILDSDGESGHHSHSDQENR